MFEVVDQAPAELVWYGHAPTELKAQTIALTQTNLIADIIGWALTSSTVSIILITELVGKLVDRAVDKCYLIWKKRRRHLLAPMFLATTRAPSDNAVNDVVWLQVAGRDVLDPSTLR